MGGKDVEGFLGMFQRKRVLIVLVSCVLFFSALVSQGQELRKPAASNNIRIIKVSGNQRIGTAAILRQIESKKGRRLSRKIIQKDIKKLHGLGYFSSVKVYFKKGILTYRIEERPSIRRILFIGNDEVDTDSLKEILKIKTYEIFDENLVRQSVREIQKYYKDKGFYLAEVSYDVQNNKEKKDEVDVLFRVQENDEIRVKKIRFLGNKNFSDARLKRVFRHTSEQGFFSWLSGGGKFKNEEFKVDLQVLEYWYLNEGYVQFSYETPIVTISEDKKWVYITIRVEEGEKYSIGDISFQGDILFSTNELLGTLTLKAGDQFSITKRNRDVLTLMEKYQNLGYANTNVTPLMNFSNSEKLVHTVYQIDKGELTRFGRINITGNTKTRDKVIRRELEVYEGELYSGVGMRRSRENVERLGFFEPGSVHIGTSTPLGDPNTVDLNVSVKEGRTGQFQFGAGYGTVSKLFLHFNLVEKNFRGMGQNLQFSAQISSDRKTRSFSVGLSDPYAFDTNWSLGGELFFTSSPYPGRFLQFRRGGGLRVGHFLGSRYSRLFLSYRLESLKHEGVDLDVIEDPFIRNDIDRENGISSSITTTFVTDKRDNRFRPSKGHYLSFREQFAGIGGNRKFFRTDVEARYYKKLFPFLTFRTKIELGSIIGYGSEEVQSTERYVLGGPSSLRGYESLSVGPRRSIFDSEIGEMVSKNAGGLNKVLGIVELEYPLIRDVGMNLVIFYDVGEVFNLDGKDVFNLNQDVGWGLRWLSPLGTLRFEWGIPIFSERKGSVFQFAIAPPF